jgi:hypothetical protein
MLLLLVGAMGVGNVQAQDSRARWIWYPDAASTSLDGATRYFRKTFELPKRAQHAMLWVMVDDGGTYWLNGQLLGPATEHRGGCTGFPVAKILRPGKNVVAVKVFNAVGPAGVIVRVVVEGDPARRFDICSDRSWKTSQDAPANWTGLDFDDAKWLPARELGDAFIKPWSQFTCYDPAGVVTAEEIAAHKAAHLRMLASPEKFAQERPAQATMTHENGSAVVTIDGQSRPAILYRGVIDPLSDQGRRQIKNFAAAGIHLFVADAYFDQVWRGPDKYDFSTVDEALRAFLSADPDAYLIAMTNLRPPEWWMTAHPTEYVHYARTDKIVEGDDAGNSRRASPASQVWREESAAAWRALVKYIEKQPWGKRVIGWHPCYGIYGEWHYFGSWSSQMPDTGEAMTRTFRAWLGKKYGSDEALRKAWNDPRATLATAAVPGVGPRQDGSLLGIRDPQRESQVMDYYRCQQRVVADCLETFGQVVKEETVGRCLYGAYYGYFFEVPPQTQGGHLEIERLLSSKVMDYFAAPYGYEWRLMGQDGRLRSPAEAFRLGGKVHMVEADTRTHLHSRNEYGRVQNLGESLAAIRREFSTALTESTALWFCDFGPNDNGGWYDDPAIMKEISRLYALAQELIRQPRQRTAEVALVCDPGSAYGLSDGEGMSTAYHLINDFATELYHTGAPFDTIYLSQLLKMPSQNSPLPQAGEGPGVRAELSRYKLLIFLNTLIVDDGQVAQIRQLQQASGPAMLWLWLPGLVSGGRLSAEHASRLTGFDLELLRTHLPGRMEITDGPLAAALRTGSGQRFIIDNGAPFGPALAARDGERMGFAQGTRHCLLASKAGGRQTFLGVPFAPRQLLAAILEAAGVHRYNSNLEDVVRGDSLLLVVHTKDGGPRNIMLPHPAKLCDALSGEMIGQGQHISVKLPPSTTAIWKLTRD